MQPAKLQSWYGSLHKLLAILCGRDFALRNWAESGTCFSPGNVHASADTSSTVMPHLEVMGLMGLTANHIYIWIKSADKSSSGYDGTNIYCELDTATEDGQLKAELV